MFNRQERDALFQIEPLEERRLLSVSLSLSHGVLTITDTTRHDHIVISHDKRNPRLIEIRADGQVFTEVASRVRHIKCREKGRGECVDILGGFGAGFIGVFSDTGDDDSGNPPSDTGGDTGTDSGGDTTGSDNGDGFGNGTGGDLGSGDSGGNDSGGDDGGGDDGGGDDGGGDDGGDDIIRAITPKPGPTEPGRVGPVEPKARSFD